MSSSADFFVIRADMQICPYAPVCPTVTPPCNGAAMYGTTIVTCILVDGLAIVAAKLMQMNELF